MKEAARLRQSKRRFPCRHMPEGRCFFMQPLLTEQECFPDPNREVAVLLHDRYVPP